MLEITYFAILVGILAAGDLISTATKARIPSLFAVSVIAVILFWSGAVPGNILELSGISIPLVYVFYYLQLPHMGAIMSVREMLAQWKTVVIALAGVVGIAAGTLTIGMLIFGKEVALIGTPPLAGGIVAYEIMRAAAEEMGMHDLAVMSLAVYVLQGFAGYPLTAFLLKKECHRLKKGLLAGTESLTDPSAVTVKVKKKLLPQLPEKYSSTNLSLFKVAVAGVIGMGITTLCDEAISRYVILLIVGVVLSEIGFLDKAPLVKSQVFGFSMVVIVGFAVINGLGGTTPEIVMGMLVPTVGIIICGLIGLLICSSIAGKLLGFSKEMAMSVALTALYGFPSNYILAQESVKVVAENDTEKEFLTQRIEPQMIVGGFATVTIASVVLAGVCVKFL